MSLLPRRIDAAIAQKVFGYNVLWTTSINGIYEPHTESEPFMWKHLHDKKWDNFRWIIPHYSRDTYPAKLVITKLKLDGFNHKLYHLPKNNLYMAIFTDGNRLFKHGSELAEKAVCLSALSVYQEEICPGINPSM